MNLATDVTRGEPSGLFARARDGDQAAWAELFRTCYPKVVRVVRRRLDRPLRSLYDSTDFANDVWKSLAAKCERFDFPSIDSLMAFLAHAAEQKVIDAYRHQHRQKRNLNRLRPLDVLSSVKTGSSTLRSPAPSPSTEVQASEILERITERLTPEGRELVGLRLEGYSNEAIAERTGRHLRDVQRFFKGLSDSWESEGGAS